MTKHFLLITFFSGLLYIGSEAQSNDPKKLQEQMARNFSAARYDSVLLNADELLRAADKINSGYYRSRACYYKANAYYKLDQTKEAVDMYYKTLKLLNDTSSLKLRAYIYNQLGSITYEQKNTVLAKNFFRQEIRLKKEAGDAQALTVSLLNLSTVFKALKQYDSSAVLLKEVKNLIATTKDPKIKGYYYSAVAVQYHGLYKRDSLQSQIDSAIANYERSLSVWLELNDQNEAFRVLFNIGHGFHDKKQYVKALGYYQRALEFTRVLNLSREKMTIYGNMAEVYYDLGDPKQAADYFRKYIELKDSILDKEAKDYTLKLDQQFKAEENRSIIRQQRLELAEKSLRIEQQNKRIYLALFIILLVAGALAFIMLRYRFKKRLDEKIEEAKKKFFSNVVHEIRTPLSMIQAPLKVLRGKLTTPEELNNIELAERNIRRLNELVNQMLDISKIDAVKYSLNETFGDLEIFFNQLLGNYKKMAADKSITLIHQYNIPHKVAFFDKDAFEKIVGNLLSNAIKYTPGGNRVGIDVDTEETEQGIDLTVSVWDTGLGIPEKDHQKIFNRFYRSSASASGTKGVGIGLALVKELVDLQKGQISLESKEGKGSTFTVKLQLKGREEQQNRPAPVKPQDESAPLILIVEDDADILNFNAAYLEQSQFRVLRARHGREALELMEKTLPDLVLTDLMMPELDGLELLKRIRQDQDTDHIPVIILSAKAAPESRMEALKIGVQGYLVKPFLPEELLSVVKNQLEILSKKKTEFKTLIGQEEKKAEEKFVGTEPYTQKLFALIFKQLDDPELSVEKLADQMATNRSHFQRKLKTITGLSPSEIIRTIRLEKARELLLARNGNITEVAYQTGFSSQSYFTKCFTQHFGLSPTQLLQKQK